MRKLSYSKRARRYGFRNTDERGVSLIAALLLLLLVSGMTVAMVLSSNSDMLINGYYRGYRGSFYAADSGLNIARQQMVNQLVAAGSGSFSVTAQPIPVGTEATVVSNINTTYGASFQSLNSGYAYGSLTETFKIDPTGTTLSAPTCTVIGGGGTCAAPTGAVTGYSYVYNYTIRAFGRSTGNQVTNISDTGAIKINVTGVAGGTATSFAAWGMFINQYNLCDGSTLVPGTITGPVFTNGAWNFGSSGSYIFTDQVGSVNPDLGYQYSDGTCDKSTKSSDKYKGTTIAPTFQSGVNLGQPSVPLPQNDYSQKRAVLDGMGSNTNPVNNNDLNAVLKDVTKTAYPKNGAASGVYLPYTVNSSGVASFNGGGIYIEGNASVTLSTSGASGQVYKIVQGGVTTTITIDPVANSTVVSSGGNTLTIVGVPEQLDPVSGAFVRDATMLYVDGNITSLSGPGQGVAAINDGTALTVTAANNVTVTGDILYKTEPVTQTQNQIPGTPADTLIPGSDHGQVLGIFTASGDIQMNNSQSNKNLEIDASIATISQGGSGGLTNTGSTINTLTIVGGRIQNQIKNINSTTRNVFFDRRFAQNGFAPPWYPSTTLTTSAPTASAYIPSVQRLAWVNNTTYY